MGRTLKLTKDQIIVTINCLRKSGMLTYDMLASKLNVTPMTVRNYLKRYDIKVNMTNLKVEDYNIMANQMLADFKGIVTINDLVTKYKVTRNTIKTMLWSAIERLNQKRKHPMKLKTLNEYKLYMCFKDGITHIDELHDMTNVSPIEITGFLANRQHNKPKR